MLKTIKRLLVQSPLHKTILALKALSVAGKWPKENNKILGNRTVYCISPYKTGTTFLSSCFDPSISKHEALHYTSMRKLNEDFEKYFVRRLNALNLKLECSGFLSAYVDELAQNTVTKDLTYICVLRKPSSWVTSAVNHHQIVKGGNQNYFWGNELYWIKHVGVDLGNFFKNDEDGKIKAAEKMIDFYMDFTRKTGKLKNVKYIWLKESQDFVPELGELINETPKLERSERNKASLHKFAYNNKEIDAAYEQLVNKLMNKS